MTYFWVFHNNELYCTFDRGFSASEVPDHALIYHREGGWSTCCKGTATNLEAKDIPPEIRAKALLLS